MAQLQSHNTTCSVCRSNPAKWLCKCANEALCPDGGCVATHLSKASRAHVLVEYAVGMAVTSEEAAACFHSFDQAVEVTEFLTREEAWLREDGENIKAAIDHQVEKYCEEIRAVGEQKKREVGNIVAQLIEGLAGYKAAERRELVLTCKRSNKHIQRLACHFGSLPLDSLIGLAKNNDTIYHIATKSEPGWTFKGAIDAVCIKPSKTVLLAGLGLTTNCTPTPLYLNSLEILKGRSTKGEVVYSHGERVTMAAENAQIKVVQLKHEVMLSADVEYTLRAAFEGGNGYKSPSSMYGSQHGVVFAATVASFAGGDIDNSSGPSGGIFFELHYMLVQF